MFRVSREKAAGRFFVVKTFLFVLGASLGIAGMVSQRDWLVVIAIVVLAIGVIFRLIDKRIRDNE